MKRSYKHIAASLIGVTALAAGVAFAAYPE